MSRPLAPLAFVCVSLLLVTFPLTLQKPGLPVNLKADEPAYYLMARSLWEDHDLRCEPRDLARISDEFLLDAVNLILMSPDQWRHVYYGKPFFGSLVAAPLVAAFGVNGFFAFNMACLLAAAWLGYRYLRRFNPDGEAAFFAIAYYLVSVSFVYVFWIHPECFHLFSVAAALFFTMHDFAPAADAPPPGPLRRLGRFIFAPGRQWLWAGIAIAPAIHAKPVYAAALIPGIVATVLRGRFRAGVALGLSALLATFAIALVQHRLTGTWSPYLGVERTGFSVHDPARMPTPEPPLVASGSAPSGRSLSRVWSDSPTGGSWSWVFAWPGIREWRIREDLRNYFVGRHTGAFVYYPFLLVSLVFFLSGGGWRSLARWGALAALVAFILFFVLWNPWNYHGGGGFVGNRYLVGLYPVGLFLVHRLRPRGMIVAGFLLGGLFLGQILFAVLGPPVDAPTLQSYMRGKPFQALPFEFTLPRQVPGYRGVVQADAYLRGRRDEILDRGGWLVLVGSGKKQLFFTRIEPVVDAAFLVENHAPGNEIELRSRSASTRLRFPDTSPSTTIAVLPLGPSDEVFAEERGSTPEHNWYLDVSAARAARPSWHGGEDDTLIGASLHHLGPSEVLGRDVYGVEWVAPRIAAEVAAGAELDAGVHVVNNSAATWTLDSPVQVHLSYRWLGADGAPAGGEGRRSVLPRPLRPGAAEWVALAVTAPTAPGAYTLVLEPVYEHVRWFGDVDPASRLAVPVCVLPAVALAASGDGI